jgi:hypothetical protein
MPPSLRRVHAVSRVRVPFRGEDRHSNGCWARYRPCNRQRLAHKGAKVVGTDVVEQRLADRAAGLRDFDVVTVTADVSAAETTSAIVAAADGRVDGLANVAGVMDAFLPPAGAGTIVNVASGAFLRASASGAAYTT